MPPNGDYNRPMQKQFQSNTIVPNKSTMVEEDDDGSPNEDEEAFGLERTATNRSKRSEVTERSAVASEVIITQNILVSSGDINSYDRPTRSFWMNTRLKCATCGKSLMLWRMP